MSLKKVLNSHSIGHHVLDTLWTEGSKERNSQIYKPIMRLKAGDGGLPSASDSHFAAGSLANREWVRRLTWAGIR